ALILRAPDQRVYVRVGVAGGTAEIGIERLGAELGGGDRERDVVPTRGLAATHPAGANLDALRKHPVVRLSRRDLVGHGNDADVGAHGERLELALVAAVLALRDRSDGCHVKAPFG